MEREPAGFCLRCQSWFRGGEGCPDCDRDPDSVFCAPPKWVVVDEPNPDDNVT